ncbi:MAG TPA: hypothetical protein VLJ58_18105, partial [Ramlibacter sp.]|nr:hypothetical protein [Ramlibacter sp.]
MNGTAWMPDRVRHDSQKAMPGGRPAHQGHNFRLAMRIPSAFHDSMPGSLIRSHQRAGVAAALPDAANDAGLPANLLPRHLPRWQHLVTPAWLAAL